MKDMLLDDFQYSVQEMLIKDKSILDLITKYQDSNARANRTIAKSITQCGCIKVHAKKQNIPEDGDLKEIQQSMKSHIEGKLCQNCRDMLEKDLGSNIFYITALCNALDLNIYDIFLKEFDRIKMLGKYTMR